jgi:DNA-binding transcriptional LysR family regulator
MSAAGREMGLSPAVVSKRISQLEERLGARLFQRTTRHLTLTETGAGYFKRVVDILSLNEEAEDFVSRRNTKPRGLLKITMPTTFSRLHIAPHLGDFMSRYPEMELDLHLTDNFIDIIREGYDLAIRIGELEDSTLVARKIAPDNRVICGSPAYLKKHGTPMSLTDLDLHNCLSAGAQTVWRVEGPEGQCQVRTNGNVRSDSGELIHQLLCAGMGLGLRSTWDIGAELKSGEIKVVLPQYRGSSNVAIHAVYPCREFMPAKVDVFIDFLAELYAPEPYWDKGLDLHKLASHAGAPKAKSRGVAKGAGAVAEAG